MTAARQQRKSPRVPAFALGLAIWGVILAPLAGYASVNDLIVVNAHRIHDGELPELGAPSPDGRGADKRDFFFLEE